MTRPPTTESGFTLVELAVVLIIVSLLLGGLFLPLSAQQDMRLQSEAEKQLAEARDALVGFAMINGRLPCPAKNPLPPPTPDPNKGRENCASPEDGLLPWAEIGVKPSDPWGWIIRYRVSPSFTTLLTAPDTFASVSNANDLTIVTRDNTAPYNKINLTNAKSIVFVLFSHGKNGFGGINTDGGSTAAAASGSDEASNATSSSEIFARNQAPAGSPLGEFDDLVTWVPRTLLVNRMVTAGKL